MSLLCGAWLSVWMSRSEPVCDFLPVYGYKKVALGHTGSMTLSYQLKNDRSGKLSEMVSVSNGLLIDLEGYDTIRFIAFEVPEERMISVFLFN